MQCSKIIIHSKRTRTVCSTALLGHTCGIPYRQADIIHATYKYSKMQEYWKVASTDHPKTQPPWYP